MALVTVSDSSLGKNVSMEQIDAQQAVTKFPSRYSYATVSHPDDPAAITVGASPFVWTNNGGKKVLVLHQGGTISKIEHGRRGTFYDIGVTGGALHLEIGDQVRVTYSVLPTMTAIPLS